MTVAAALNEAQFKRAMGLVRRMLDHIDNIQSAALSQLAKMKAETDTLEVR